MRGDVCGVCLLCQGSNALFAGVQRGRAGGWGARCAGLGAVAGGFGHGAAALHLAGRAGAKVTRPMGAACAP